MTIEVVITKKIEYFRLNNEHVVINEGETVKVDTEESIAYIDQDKVLIGPDQYEIIN